MTVKRTNNSRRGERALAFQVLYALEFADKSANIDSAFCSVPRVDDEEIKAEGFAYNLVQGVCDKHFELDEIISSFAKNWRIERLGKVEITILRLAVYEIKFRDDIPNKVAINESLELAKQFADAKSLAFINGILDAIAKADNASSE